MTTCARPRPTPALPQPEAVLVVLPEVKAHVEFAACELHRNWRYADGVPETDLAALRPQGRQPKQTEGVDRHGRLRR